MREEENWEEDTWEEDNWEDEDSVRLRYMTRERSVKSFVVTILLSFLIFSNRVEWRC